MVQYDDFSALLKETGQFDDLEIRILRSIMVLSARKTQKMTAAFIAKEAGVSVTNAYKYLYSLQKKGLVESNEEKNKTFWLARSVNPFPRLFAYMSEEYMKKKELFKKLEDYYSSFISKEQIWGGEKIYEHYADGFVEKASLLFELAKQEIIITTDRLYDNIILLDGIRRAIERGVKIRVISEEIHPETVSKLKKIGIEMRLGKAWPYVVLVDGRHGITSEGNKGVWFLNQDTTYKFRFEEIWEKAQGF